jgi:hypothetical protein
MLASEAITIADKLPMNKLAIAESNITAFASWFTARFFYI